MNNNTDQSVQRKSNNRKLENIIITPEKANCGAYSCEDNKLTLTFDGQNYLTEIKKW